VNQTIKILKRPFKIALEQGFIDRNPVAAVRPIRTRSAKKGVFSPEQIRCLFEVAEGDWKGLILASSRQFRVSIACGTSSESNHLIRNRQVTGSTPIVGSTL